MYEFIVEINNLGYGRLDIPKAAEHLKTNTKTIKLLITHLRKREYVAVTEEIGYFYVIRALDIFDDDSFIDNSNAPHLGEVDTSEIKTPTIDITGLSTDSLLTELHKRGVNLDVAESLHDVLTSLDRRLDERIVVFTKRLPTTRSSESFSTLLRSYRGYMRRTIIDYMDEMEMRSSSVPDESIDSVIQQVFDHIINQAMPYLTQQSTVSTGQTSSPAFGNPSQIRSCGSEYRPVSY